MPESYNARQSAADACPPYLTKTEVDNVVNKLHYTKIIS